LTDSLLARAGIIDEEQAGSKRGTDTMDEEKERGITIRSTGVTMAFDGVLEDDVRCILHLVDSPGYVYCCYYYYYYYYFFRTFFCFFFFVFSFCIFFLIVYLFFSLGMLTSRLK
jgi:hypothetical protein